MKVIKYPQSCLLIETKNKKILVDPGNLKYNDSFFDNWSSADIILITHRHGDHINSNVISKIEKKIYSSSEVANAFPELKINIVKENDKFTLDDVSIEVVKAIHGFNPNLKDGKEVFENIGFIVDDGRVRLYITSDTICFNNDYKADIIVAPITAHGLTMSSYELSLYSKQIGAKLVLPVHMDNDIYPSDLEYMKKNFNKFQINYKILSIGEIIEI